MIIIFDSILTSKQPNIVVDGNETILLANFGLSVIGDVGSSYTAPDGKGTTYIAPELLDCAKGFPRPTFQSDIYSFAYVCVEVRYHFHITGWVLC